MGHFDKLQAKKVVANSVTLAGELNGYRRPVLRQTVFTTTTTLTTADSGSVILLDKDEATAITLPAIGANDIGVTYTFIQTVASNNDRTINTAYDNDYFVGGVTLNFDGASTDSTGTYAFITAGSTDVQITFDDDLPNAAGGVGSQVTCTAVLTGNTASGGGAKLVWAVEGSMIAQAENSNGTAIFT